MIKGYHIVLRPPLNTLPDPAEVQSVLINLKGSHRYLVSLEKGKSTGNEEWNHFDIVLELTRDIRVDSLKRSLCDSLNIAKENRKNCKVFAIDDRTIEQQVGYALKEGIKHYSSYDEAFITKAKMNYKDDMFKSKEKFTDDKWSIDDVADNYRKWLLEQFNSEFVDQHNAEVYIIKWLQENRHKIKFSVWQKVNKDKLIEYVSG